MKTALVYDRVNTWGGAERVMLALHELFPNAPLYTSVYNAPTAPWASVFPSVIPSFLQTLKPLRSHHDKLALLTHIAFESFDFSEYDLVISVTSEAAKGIITRPATKHICYCLTPTRYLWSGYDDYFSPSLKRLAKPFVSHLKNWDYVAAQRPDEMIAISTEVQKRIQAYYDRDTDIIFPPTQRVAPKETPRVKQLARLPYFLVVSRLVKYKQVDLVIEWANRYQERVVIIGDGRRKLLLQRQAGTSVEFVSGLADEELAYMYAHAEALIMPQFEDFGLVAVESQMHGTPVIAYGHGGVLDTVIDGKTGVYFSEQVAESLQNAVALYREKRFNVTTIRHNAMKFSKEKFKKNILNLIKE